MTRRYDMRKRDRSAAATRDRILEAAHRLLDGSDRGGLSVGEVADAAGVSRATVYNRIGPRGALLAAVFEDQGRRIEYDRVLAAMRLDDPARAAIETVRESCRAWAVMPAAIRKTLALAVIDDEIGILVRRYEGYRREELRTLARRLERAGALRPGLGVPGATVALTLVTGFHAFDALRSDLDETAATDRLVELARAALGLSD